MIDAAAVIAAADSADPEGERVRGLLAGERGDLVMSALVAAEVDYLLVKRYGRGANRAFLRDLARGVFRVEALLESEYRIALALDQHYTALDLGLADISTIILADRFQTRRLYTFDQRHFRAVTTLGGEPFLLLPADSVSPASARVEPTPLRQRPRPGR
jgi:predicted nucleic acid-binding protein